MNTQNIPQRYKQ